MGSWDVPTCNPPTSIFTLIQWWIHDVATTIIELSVNGHKNSEHNLGASVPSSCGRHNWKVSWLIWFLVPRQPGMAKKSLIVSIEPSVNLFFGVEITKGLTTPIHQMTAPHPPAWSTVLRAVCFVIHVLPNASLFRLPLLLLKTHTNMNSHVMPTSYPKEGTHYQEPTNCGLCDTQRFISGTR